MHNDTLGLRVIPLSAVTAEEILLWRDLAGRAVEPNPFAQAELVLPAARHLPGGPEVQLLVVESATGFDLCLPVRLAPRWRRLPVRAVVGWSHPYSFLGTPLVDARNVEGAVADLLGGLRQARLGDLLVIPGLGDGGPVAAALMLAVAAGGLGHWWFGRTARATLALDERRLVGSAALSPARQKSLRRSRRRLAEVVGGLEVVDRAGEAAAVDAFLRVEASGWKGRAGTSMGDRPADAAFFAELCRSFAGAGALELLSLEGPGGVAAMQCNLRAGDTLFCFKVAFDERWAPYSPGLQLEVDAVERFFGQRAVSVMDSCADPGNATINALWPGRRQLAHLALAVGGRRARAVTTVGPVAAAWRATGRAAWRRLHGRQPDRERRITLVQHHARRMTAEGRSWT